MTMFLRRALVFFLLLTSAAAQLDVRDDDEDLGFGNLADYSQFDPYGAMDPYGMGGGDPYGGQPAPRKPQQLESLEEIESFLNEDDSRPAVIGYFPADYETTDAGDYEVFMQVAMEDGSDYRFAFTANADVMKTKKYENAVVFAHLPSREVQTKHGERAKSRYPGKILKTGTFKQFVEEKTLSLVGELSPYSAPRYERVTKPILTVFTAVDYAKNPSAIKYAVNRVVKTATDLKGKIVFTLANAKDFVRSMTEQYMFEGIEESGAPSKVRVGLRDGNMYYKMEEDFSADAVTRFVEAFRAGSLVGHEHKNEPQPGGGDEDFDDSQPTDVVTVSDSNIKEVVTNSEADVMIEFYAPWCGHCKALKPVYSQLASKYVDDAGVTIAAMDATANEVPAGFDVQGYPTLYFVRADKKTDPIPYEGSRDQASMIKFINQHRSTHASSSN